MERLLTTEAMIATALMAVIAIVSIAQMTQEKGAIRKIVLIRLLFLTLVYIGYLISKVYIFAA